LFWTVLANIAGLDLFYFSGDKAVIERKEILIKLKLGITDMGKKVIRNDDSSSDEKLTPVEYIDILKIIEENPLIEKLILTSSSGNVSANKWFSNYLLEHKLSLNILKGRKPIKNKLSLNQKEIQIVTLYSTSRRAANRITLEKLIELYKDEIIYSTCQN